MKTAFISTYDIEGGAARATYWLANGLRQMGVDVSMRVQRKLGDYAWVYGSTGKIKNALDLMRPTLDTLPLQLYPKKKRSQWSLNLLPNPGLVSTISTMQPDIVNIHWVGGGFLPLSQFRKLTAPIVWSLYDMWAFTGGCHYDGFCGRYSDSCGNCPQLNSATNDLSRWIHRKKRTLWQNLPMTIVSPSKWLAEEAKRSTLFCNLRVEVIPHGTDLKVFKPIDKSLAREILGLPKEGHLALFGAMAGTSDTRKGYQYLEPALKSLAAKSSHNDLRLMVFGSSEPANPPDLGFPVHYLGRLHDDVSLAVLYSAADVTVTPSTQEAFGMSASESFACGTPVVAFGATGVLDVVDHKMNGYLAVPYEVDDLANGISWVLSDKDRLKQLSFDSRKKCEEKFDLKIVAKQYSDLYEELIAENIAS